MFDDEKIKIIQSMPEGDALLVIWIRLIYGQTCIKNL